MSWILSTSRRILTTVSWEPKRGREVSWDSVLRCLKSERHVSLNDANVSFLLFVTSVLSSNDMVWIYPI